MNRLTYKFTLTRYILVTSIIVMAGSLFGQPGYWQQKADYEIAIDLNAAEKSYTGTTTLLYTNHSPDTMYHVYFHLFYNAFQPNSLMDIRSQQIPDVELDMDKKLSLMPEAHAGRVDIWYLSQDDQPVTFSIEGTLLTALLPEAILPGQTVRFSMEFFVKIPKLIRRAGFDSQEGVSFSMAQWYPKICMYDNEGWHANQYLGREFYSNFGDYKVDILIDSNYIVAAGADTFVTFPVPGTSKKLWRFNSFNVIDFAWAADPDYKIYSTKSDCGVEINMYYLPDFNPGNIWQQTGDALGKILPTISKRFGQYPYANYTVIQAGDGGMEYPKCTFITGDRSIGSLMGVTIHELMHTWFQSVVANNENKNAWMDEGFVSFATTEIKQYMQNIGLIFGPGKNAHPYEEQQQDYRYFVTAGVEETMNTPADFFQTSSTYYLAAYTKGELFLKQLEYIIGKQDFDKSLRNYYQQWKFRHPKPVDFQQVLEKTSGIELDWFFHYWLNTTHYIDLEIAVDTTTEDLFHIHIMNKGNILMPVDLLIEYSEGVSSLFYIPLDLMQWPKDPNADTDLGETMTFTMEPWTWPYVSYVISLSLKAPEIKKVSIDPSKRLVDVKPENNVWINN